MSRILITGASRGIGRALALRFAARKDEVLLLGRASDEQRETEAQLRAVEADFQFFECDLAQRAELDRAAAAVLEGGAPDVVIHNAALIDRASCEELSDESWDRQIEVNLTAPMRLTRALLAPMKKRGSGRVLFVSSISAVLGSKNQGAYHASKAGLLGYMRCLAEELSDTGLMTMALLPGSVDTDMLRGSGFPPRMTPDDIAKTLAFYALEAPLASNGAVVESFGI